MQDDLPTLRSRMFEKLGLWLDAHAAAEDERFREGATTESKARANGKRDRYEEEYRATKAALQSLTVELQQQHDLMMPRLTVGLSQRY
jgi:hypothetical protein